MIHPVVPLVAGPFFARIQHFNGRLVGLQIPLDFSVFEQVLPENFQSIHALGRPSVECRSGNGDVLPQETLTLAVQGQVVDVFVGQDCGQQAWTRNAFVNNTLGQGADADSIDTFILRGILVADVPFNIEPGRGQFQLLGHLSANADHSGQIAFRMDLNHFDRQVIRQGQSPFVGGPRLFFAGIGDLFGQRLLLFGLLGGAGLKRQGRLPGRGKPLAFLSEQHPLEVGNLRLQIPLSLFLRLKVFLLLLEQGNELGFRKLL